jgi:hypothetical protein
MSDIFISYANEDRPRVKPLVDALAQMGWSVWWDRTILAGKRWEEVIEKRRGRKAGGFHGSRRAAGTRQFGLVGTRD